MSKSLLILCGFTVIALAVVLGTGVRKDGSRGTRSNALAGSTPQSARVAPLRGTDFGNLTDRTGVRDRSAAHQGKTHEESAPWIDPGQEFPESGSVESLPSPHREDRIESGSRDSEGEPLQLPSVTQKTGKPEPLTDTSTTAQQDVVSPQIEGGSEIDPPEESKGDRVGFSKDSAMLISAGVPPEPDSTDPSPGRASVPRTGSGARAVASAAPRPPSAPEESPRRQIRFRLVPEIQDAVVGESIELAVEVSTSESVIDAPVHLSYDPQKLRFQSATPGDFLRSDASEVVFLANDVPGRGEIFIGAGRQDRRKGVSGDGVLCRVRLVTIAVGVSAVVMAEAMAWDSEGNPLIATTTSAMVAARQP
jgi:hypothetical protein